MDIDAEFNLLRAFKARAEPVIAAFEAQQGDGMGAPDGFSAAQWRVLSPLFDLAGWNNERLAVWEAPEGDLPQPIQDLAARIIQRIDRLELRIADVEKIAGEVARLSRLSADLAEIIEARLGPTGAPSASSAAAGTTAAHEAE